MKKRFYPAALGLLTAALFSNCKKSDVVPVTASAQANLTATTLAATTTTVTGSPMKNMFGVNGFEWDFLQNPADPSNVSTIFEPKYAAIKNFTGFRHYIEWNRLESTQGKYTFNPAHSGNFNFDIIYQRAKQDSIFMLADIKDCPDWFLSAYYPSNMRDAEDVPAPYTADKSNPASYVLQGKMAFQFAARYGSNASVDKSLVSVDQSARWTGDPVNQIKTGLNTVKYIECDNERDKWWKGTKAQQTAQEYAANMSAFYDGDKGKLGKNVGVKNADPNMIVVMGGLSTAKAQYVQDMIDWCKTHRGYRKDGSVDLCFDVINYHLYNNDGSTITGKSATKGVAPELGDAATIADSFVKVSQSLPSKPEVWVTEAGYDLNQGSIQRAWAIGSKTAELTQADWNIRTALLYMRHGINRLFFFNLFDDNASSSGTYATSGLINSNYSRRASADYIVQVKSLMGNYTFSKSINADPMVDKYVSGTKSIYTLHIPDQKGRTASYTLDLGTTVKAVNIYNLKKGQSTMTKTTANTSNGKLTLTVTETPVFVQPQ